ncbi:MAG: hypothetical protein KDJ14_10970 [Xanthomonadales bacterium]|nr:hypothetical protein [Xanthomonadales bacterium]
MFLQLRHAHPEDAVERAVPDLAAANQVLERCRPDVEHFLARRNDQYRATFGSDIEPTLARCETALRLGLTRLGVRHGSWGDDFHHYHNENHVLEILDGRIGQMISRIGLASMALDDWMALSLFAACHDLRQREEVDFSYPVGNNESASIAETRRILAQCGFDPKRDRRLMMALDLMIAGSTFDPRPTPPPSEFNSAEVVATAGALAPKLDVFLDHEMPGWRDDSDAVRGVELAHIASDLDTANVGEAFAWLAESASRLCQEREMRGGRALEDAVSGDPCVGFLSTGQERYFFELHQFCSLQGRATFGEQKSANAGPLRRVAEDMRQTFDGRRDQVSGLEVVRTFSKLALKH